MQDISFSIFRKYKNLKIIISEKKDGSMKIFKKNDCAWKNRKAFFLKNNFDSIISAGLDNGNKISVVSKKDIGNFIKGVDGLITNEKNIFLSITVADCLPIFFYDYKNKVVGLVHAGWKSLGKEIVKETITNFSKKFKTKPSDLIVGIGPGISECHFKVKNDVLSKFKTYKDSIIKRNGKTFLDLKKIAFKQLLELGIKRKNIETNKDCTYCLKEKYFSFRRDKPKNLKAMIVLIGQE